MVRRNDEGVSNQTQMVVVDVLGSVEDRNSFVDVSACVCVWLEVVFMTMYEVALSYAHPAIICSQGETERLR